MKTLCSYSAINAPSTAGVSDSASSMFVGRLPSNTRNGTIAAGTPSAATSAAVFPNASASACANKFAINLS